MTELGWRWEALQDIKPIEETRQSNNLAWMALLRLAVLHAPPAELKAVLQVILRNDTRISELCTRLIEHIPDSQ